MIKFGNTEVVGWKSAITGMRNALNSWKLSDTKYEGLVSAQKVELVPGVSTCVPIEGEFDIPKIGPNDYSLMMKLRNAGTDHRKFMRMIVVYVDILAPLYWWKEFDTYRMGVEKNSCSTMHKIADKEFELEDFSLEHLGASARRTFEVLLDELNYWRDAYLDFSERSMLFDVNGKSRFDITRKLKPDAGEPAFASDDGEFLTKKQVWWQMIQLLPSNYNQRRTVMMNYEVLANIYKSRKAHKLDCWRIFCNEWIPTLPYHDLITGIKKEADNVEKYIG